MCPDEPKVSVLMSVYNGARYLKRAMDSILSQTLGDFEFIIVDDGSTDETSSILERYVDPRIVILRNEVNLGLTKSLNRGLGITKAEYVARQDADDLSLSNRLASQVQFLDAHPSVSLVGTGFVRIDEHERDLSIVKMPVAPDQIREMLFYAHCLCHGSVMVRRVNLQAVGGYNERFVTAQDTDLWLRLSEIYQLANLPDPLYRLRMHADSVTGQSRSLQRQAAHRARAEAMARCLSQVDRWRPSALTLGRFHFSQAMQALEDGRSDRAQENLSRASVCNPRLDDDADYLVRMAAHRAFEIGPAGTARFKTDRDVREGRSFVRDLFALLPGELRSVQSRRRWLAAELHTAYAFAAFEEQSLVRTLQHCFSAWYYQPSRLKHRGLVSVFGRALIGSKRDSS